MRTLVLAASSVMFFRCLGGTINAGTNDAGSDGNPNAQSDAASGTNFTGYLESFQLLSGSDAVAMNLVFAADGTVSGKVHFGNEPAFPPPTDPNVGWPPSPNDPLERTAFHVTTGTYAAPRVTLKVQEVVPLYKAWCELQTPVLDEVKHIYGCLPSWGSGPCATPDGGPFDEAGVEGAGCCLVPPDGGMVPVDCGKLQLCEGFGTCSCTASGCTEPPEDPAKSPIAFDMQLNGGHLDGRVSGLNGAPGLLNVHLTQVP